MFSILSAKYRCHSATRWLSELVYCYQSFSVVCYLLLVNLWLPDVHTLCTSIKVLAGAPEAIKFIRVCTECYLVYVLGSMHEVLTYLFYWCSVTASIPSLWGYSSIWGISVKLPVNLWSSHCPEEYSDWIIAKRVVIYMRMGSSYWG